MKEYSLQLQEAAAHEIASVILKQVDTALIKSVVDLWLKADGDISEKIADESREMNSDFNNIEFSELVMSSIDEDLIESDLVKYTRAVWLPMVEAIHVEVFNYIYNSLTQEEIYSFVGAARKLAASPKRELVDLEKAGV